MLRGRAITRFFSKTLKLIFFTFYSTTFRFLTNAFAAPQHYADHPSNNPFAEDTPPPQTAAEQAQEATQLHEEAHARAREEARQLHSDNWERDHPGERNPHHLPTGFILGGRNAGNNIRMRNGPPAGVGAIGGLRVVPGPPNENQTPMNYLVSLINSIGGGLFDASGERRSNLGDYAFGDAGFASILQDLMEQVSLIFEILIFSIFFLLSLDFLFFSY